MKKRIIAIAFTLSLIVMVGCSSTQSVGSGFGSPNVTHLLDARGNYLLDSIATTSGSYGFSKGNPIMVGGGEENGVENTRRYLELLAGPNGEIVTFGKVESCCRFNTNNEQNNPYTYLDRYILRYRSVAGETTKYVYVNRYDSNTLQIPKGFKRKSDFKMPPRKK